MATLLFPDGWSFPIELIRGLRVRSALGPGQVACVEAGLQLGAVGEQELGRVVTRVMGQVEDVIGERRRAAVVARVMMARQIRILPE